jgi:2-methylcitrate dehydratase PrpD
MADPILSRWLQPALAEPTSEALQMMRLSLLDWMACGIAGAQEPVAQICRDMALDEGGAPQASLFGNGRVPMRAAALVNGATSHALDYDDTHFAHIGHPSVAVLPAALAVAEAQNIPFDAFLRASLAGVEASIRIGIRLGRGHYQIGYHQTATAGAFGATIAAGLLLKLSDSQMGHAIGLVSTRAAGLKSQFGSMGKPYNAGIAATAGVEAALLAARGFQSNPDALEGQNGFFATHHADGVDSDAPGFLFTQISHKFHACCHGLHATLEALSILKPIDPDVIEAVDITTHPRWLTVCNQPAPQTGLEAKFSYRMVSALSLLGHDTAALNTYSDALCQDPKITALRDKVTVTGSENLPETAANLRLKINGHRVEVTFDLNTPMPLATRQTRLQVKGCSLIGTDKAQKIWQAIEANDLAALTAQI